MTRGEDASNAGKTWQRYTLMGESYRLGGVDPAGETISDYALVAPIEACMPLPDALRSKLTDIAIVAINPDESLTILASSVKITARRRRHLRKHLLAPGNPHRWHARRTATTDANNR